MCIWLLGWHFRFNLLTSIDRNSEVQQGMAGTVSVFICLLMASFEV